MISLIVIASFFNFFDSLQTLLFFLVIRNQCHVPVIIYGQSIQHCSGPPNRAFNIYVINVSFLCTALNSSRYVSRFFLISEFCSPNNMFLKSYYFGDKKPLLRNRHWNFFLIRISPRKRNKNNKNIRCPYFVFK